MVEAFFNLKKITYLDMKSTASQDETGLTKHGFVLLQAKYMFGYEKHRFARTIQITCLDS